VQTKFAINLQPSTQKGKSMKPFAIRTENLSRDFGDLHAVDQLSMEVPAGIIFGFLGPNGAGKTTTIRLLLGLLEPSAGSAEVLGFDALTQSEQIRQRSGALLEYSGIYERLSAEDNLEFYGRVWRIPTSQRKARIQELLTHMGLWERRKELAGSWSRGMKQKLAVARSLLHRPALIFLDEPTAGLDPIAAVELRDDLASLAAKEGVTIFLTTHNLAEAEKLCAQVGIIRSGKLLACGPLEELRSQAGGPKLEVTGHGFTTELIQKIQSLPDIESATLQNSLLTITLKRTIDTAPLVSLLVGSGIQVEEVRRGAASLEDAFLALVDED
jgi:ABC-2 type transport system ATP-binding protein